MDIMKIKDLREKARDDALALCYGVVNEHAKKDDEGAKGIREKVDLLMSKVEAYDEIMALTPAPAAPQPLVLQPFTTHTPLPMPPRKTQEELAAESKQQSDAIWNDESTILDGPPRAVSLADVVGA